MHTATPMPQCAAPCEITQLSATALSEAIHARRYSCEEVMRAYLARIAALNPGFNALISLREPQVLLREARACDDLLARGQSQGWMHGMPQAIKDLAATRDVPTVMGSPVLRGHRPKQDALVVQRMKAAGAIVIGKTNVPEFGLGSHTFNAVFGATKNAYDPTKSAGGSSGGGAVALATHMLPVADGSDFMGSLRNPAGWNNVVGFRPSQGRVPMQPAADVWINQLSTEGPMGRTVEDVARLLATQSGYDVRSPLSLQTPFDLDAALRPLTDAALARIRIGWLADLGGYLPTEEGILAVCQDALQRAQHSGCKVETVEGGGGRLGFEPQAVWEAWLVWRGVLVASRLGAVLALPGAREQMRAEALWEVEQARSLGAAQFAQASAVRTGFHAAMLRLLQRYDALALPVAQVWPFELQQHYPTRIQTPRGPVAMSTYHRWMECTLYATFAGLPAISIPAGFGAQGLPMGLQLIGRPAQDETLLRMASALLGHALPAARGQAHAGSTTFSTISL